MVLGANMLNAVSMSILGWFIEYIIQIGTECIREKSSGMYGTKDGRILY
jgi:hypothetical protein